MNFDVNEIKTVLDQQGEAFEAKMRDMQRQLDEIQLKANRPSAGPIANGADPAIDPADRKALDLAVRALITGDQSKAYRHFSEAKGMSVGSDPDGGYVVHNLISTGMTRVMAEISPLYRLARKVPMTTGSAFEEPIDVEALDATWAGEQDARTDTDTPRLKLLTVPLCEIFTQPKVTQKLVDTAGLDVVQWLIAKSGESFALKEGTAFHTGDGVAKPRGFLSYPTASTGDATRPWGTLQYIVTGSSGAFPSSSTTVNPADVLVNVQSALKAQYRAGAVWLMNRTTAGVARKLKDSEGRHVWVDGLVQGQPSMLLGHPVEVDEDMPDIGADQFAIAFGNFEKAYTVVEQPGVRFLADPYTAKPHVRLFSYRRVGGAVNNTEAIKLLKFGTS